MGANEIITGGTEFFDGGSGFDRLTVNTASTAPFVVTLVNVESAIGNAERDTFIVASSGAVELSGAGGDDDLRGGSGGDFIDGGADNDVLVGLGGADTLFGGTGADTFFFVGANDSPLAASDSIEDFEGGEDTLHLFFADQGQVGLKVEAGYTQVFFGVDGTGAFTNRIDVIGDIRAADILTSTGTINVFGSTGNDTLISGVGADFIFGDAGDDFIVGQTGADRLVGGGGADTFFYGGMGDSAFAARDRVFDFQSGLDKVHVFFSDAGQVAIRYVGGYSEVYFGNDGTGNFSDMVEVYGDLVQAGDLITSDPSVFVFP